MYPDTQDCPYDLYPYSGDANGYFVGEQEGIEIEYTGSSSLDDQDRDRRRRRTSLAKEKEALSNMHMVTIPGSSGRGGRKADTTW